MFTELAYFMNMDIFDNILYIRVYTFYTDIIILCTRIVEYTAIARTTTATTPTPALYANTRIKTIMYVLYMSIISVFDRYYS